MQMAVDKVKNIIGLKCCSKRSDGFATLGLVKDTSRLSDTITIQTSAYAPTDAIAFGDYKYYNIGDRGSRSFKGCHKY